MSAPFLCSDGHYNCCGERRYIDYQPVMLGQLSYSSYHPTSDDISWMPIQLKAFQHCTSGYHNMHAHLIFTS